MKSRVSKSVSGASCDTLSSMRSLPGNKQWAPLQLVDKFRAFKYPPVKGRRGLKSECHPGATMLYTWDQ